VAHFRSFRYSFIREEAIPQFESPPLFLCYFHSSLCSTQKKDEGWRSKRCGSLTRGVRSWDRPSAITRQCWTQQNAHETGEPTFLLIYCTLDSATHTKHEVTRKATALGGFARSPRPNPGTVH